MSFKKQKRRENPLNGTKFKSFVNDESSSAHNVTSVFFTEFILCQILFYELKDFYRFNKECYVYFDIIFFITIK